MPRAETTGPASRRAVTLAVLVAALGYFVDIYDLLLFSIIRGKSLQDLGLAGPALLDRGVMLLNAQMLGLLIGGLLWGVLGDKRGRLSVLFGSIVLYSAANIVNGLVTNVTQYAVVRFIAGVGLAGELGAGVTLVSELMNKETRGYGTAIVAAVGICGAIVAAFVGEQTSWRTAFFIGGGLGVLLLLLRIGVLESGLWNRAKQRTGAHLRGDLRLLLTGGGRLRRYVSVILIGVPIWYVVSILVTFAPEVGRALGMQPVPSASRAVLFTYTGLVFGDLGSGLLSQLARSRRKVVAGFLMLTAFAVVLYFTVGRTSLTAFYGCCVLLGVATGYWAVFMTVASEQFGTNIRATVTTTAPNFVRGSVVLVTMLFQALKPVLGVVASAAGVGALTIVAGLLALRGLDETYGRDLDFIDE